MRPHYGGQALIEGVLIRGRVGVVVAVRAPDGSVVTREERFDAGKRTLARRLPILRGIVALRETLGVGTRMLMFSADVAAGGTGDSLSPMSRRAAFGAAIMAATVFAAIPNLLARSLGRRRNDAAPRSRLWSSLVEGGVRIGILLGYLAVIGRLQAVHDILPYHAARHTS